MHERQKSFDQAVRALGEKFTEKQDPKDDLLIMNKSYLPRLLDLKNFHAISRINKINNKDVSENLSNIAPKYDNIKYDNIMFIDGGNTILFESAGFSLGFVRVAAITYNENKRAKKSLWEFYMIAQENDGMIVTETFPKNCFDSMIFNPEDASLRNGLERADCSRIIPAIRRLAELDMACRSDSSKIDLIMLDGTLEARYPYEKDFVDRLMLTGKAAALSKTCTLTIRSGVGVTKRLMDLSEELEFMKQDIKQDMNRKKLDSGWYYSDAVISNNPLHTADIFFLKLNRLSNHVFRLDVQRNFSGSTDNLISQLALNSTDPVFPGYPYGLIDADSHARISDHEKETLSVAMMALLKGYKNSAINHLSSTNAHSILDKIKF